MKSYPTAGQCVPDEQEVEAANELARPQLQLQDEKASDVDGDPEPPSAVEAMASLDALG